MGGNEGVKVSQELIYHGSLYLAAGKVLLGGQTFTVTVSVTVSLYLETFTYSLV